MPSNDLHAQAPSFTPNTHAPAKTQGNSSLGPVAPFLPCHQSHPIFKQPGERSLRICKSQPHSPIPSPPEFQPQARTRAFVRAVGPVAVRVSVSVRQRCRVQLGEKTESSMSMVFGMSRLCVIGAGGEGEQDGLGVGNIVTLILFP